MEFLKGKTLVYFAVEESAVEFITEDLNRYVLESMDGPPNDCHVWVESVVGNVNDLLNTPLLMAEEATSSEDMTWTFYKFATIKGYVDIRFCGQSNGYYCEKAELCHLGQVTHDTLQKLKSNLKK